ncbi:GABA transporter 1 isoform X2 [Physcomitrium patens]|nr:GABA transporter 1-like isoform X2 [Physcomitrium patens]|eukprot:XP_024372214.1 GABA transporter 1-like isoform X2 [Physcomitrella patens]
MAGEYGTTMSPEACGGEDKAIYGTAIIKDGGALFVLESKGNWKHAGFHLSTSIVAPALLSLPYAMKGLGWAPGFLALIIGAVVSFYAYMRISKVLEQAELEGHRLLRFRDMGGYVLGRTWGYYPVSVLQIGLCLGAMIGCIVLGGQSMKLIYKVFHPNGSMQLYVFTIIFGMVMAVFSQLPSFHSLRYINLLSLLCSLGYSLSAVGGCIYAGHSNEAPPRDYAVVGSPGSKAYGVFNSLVIIATTYGNGIIPEIQATLAPPVTGKMFKGLLVCYAVVITTFFSVAAAGYWAFGNEAQGNIFINIEPFVPKWLNFLSNALVLAQLLAVALVYAQPTFEIFEGKSSNIQKGKYSARNLVPRLILRSALVAITTLISAAIPFFGDINAVIGSFGFTPLDFVLPFILYAGVFHPSPRTPKYWLHWTIVIVFSIVGLLGCVASVRQVVLVASTYKLFANIV